MLWPRLAANSMAVLVLGLGLHIAAGIIERLTAVGRVGKEIFKLVFVNEHGVAAFFAAVAVEVLHQRQTAARLCQQLAEIAACDRLILYLSIGGEITDDGLFAGVDAAVLLRVTKGNVDGRAYAHMVVAAADADG